MGRIRALAALALLALLGCVALWQEMPRPAQEPLVVVLPVPRPNPSYPGDLRALLEQAGTACARAMWNGLGSVDWIPAFSCSLERRGGKWGMRGMYRGHPIPAAPGWPDTWVSLSGEEYRLRELP